MPAATTRGLRMLGGELRKRREVLGYPSMRALRDATADTVRPSYVIMMAAENGTRANITGPTWDRIAETYQVTRASVAAVMAGRAVHLQPAAVLPGEHARAVAAAAEAALGHLDDAAAVLTVLASPPRAPLARGAKYLTALAGADVHGLAAGAQILATIAALDRAKLTHSAQSLRELARVARVAQARMDEEEAAVSPAPRAAG
jgi:hypothetical protein